MADTRDLLRRTAELAADFLDSLDDRPVFPRASVDELRDALGGPLADGPTDPQEVIEQLAAAADPGLVAMPSGRYFGFVIGGGLPASLAADWLASAWDQNAGLYVGGPVRRPSSRRSCATGSSTCSGCRPTRRSASSPARRWPASPRLAAARYRVLEQAGWDVGRDGLAGAPRIRVARRRQAPRHDRPRAAPARARRARGRSPPTSRAGWTPSAGASARERRRADDRLRAGRRGEHRRLRPASSRSQTPRAAAGAWLHVDGAFGLWAAAPPGAPPPRRGASNAPTRGSTDAHKWLNVPYDSALVLCADPEAHRAAMTVTRARTSCSDGSARPRPGRLGAGVLAPRARLRRLRRAALARPQRRRRARRAHVRAARAGSRTASPSCPAPSS